MPGEMRARGPYWRPGMNSNSEPWVALAECATGHLVVPCHRNAGHARAVVSRWEALHVAGLSATAAGVMVGAAVVDPAGEVVEGWGSCPVPGSPRWPPLRRLADPATCPRCLVRRWPGCWVAVRLDGCSACLPAVEMADPRVWPSEPALPPLA